MGNDCVCVYKHIYSRNTNNTTKRKPLQKQLCADRPFESNINPSHEAAGHSTALTYLVRLSDSLSRCRLHVITRLMRDSSNYLYKDIRSVYCLYMCICVKLYRAMAIQQENSDVSTSPSLLIPDTITSQFSLFEIRIIILKIDVSSLKLVS